MRTLSWTTAAGFISQRATADPKDAQRPKSEPRLTGPAAPRPRERGPFKRSILLKADSVASKRVADALKSGVKVVACENTMKALKLVYGDMLPDIGCVPAGVVELMKRQREGYAYIRP